MGKERFPLEISHRGSVDALLYEISCILDLTLSAAIYPSSKFLTYSYVPARSLCIYIFLPMAKTSNVSTSLVAISADLSGFDKSNQLITTYLSAFTGFLIIWVKIGPYVGLKTALLGSLILFTFSAGCGTSQSINKLLQLKRSVVAAAAGFPWEADAISAFLLLGTVVFLEEGGTASYAWGSGFIIASFVVSGNLLMGLLLWQ
ncbi:putative efflux pump antibiotic resistance protein [Eutypa lata UCREL1]|uniref:Putative efflux pump antibiotic resistance protein n=1 Tax=Eutypa lata (strain UCR-EL1) TaxID=1287681 RepID=M7SKF2_EUTLA|nr:putative efflux pump antibiotic resistance protein [Eutypa lata UCREL1]